MKKLILIFTLLFSVLFSSSSFSEWIEIGTTVDGTTFYVDFKSIKKHDRYVYYWDLGDYVKPEGRHGNLSVTNYNQVDCELNRRKNLTQTQHEKHMAQGRILSRITEPDKNWSYPPPESLLITILSSVCKFAEQI